MMKENEVRNLERKARALIAGKDIPKSRMDVVRALLVNETLNPEERYLSIIDLIKSCPDKKARRPERGRIVAADSRQWIAAGTDEPRAARDDVADLYSPLESSENVDAILQKYRHLKLFRKRYLVHRNNRFGIGFRKRLIPTRRLQGIFSMIYGYQEELSSALSKVMNRILEDENEKDPTLFNYVKLLRKWLSSAPMIKYRYDELKWMERHQFEREFRSYAATFFSVKKIDARVKESILEGVTRRLRPADDPTKNARSADRQTEKKKSTDRAFHQKEKETYHLVLLLRSFLSTLNDDELPLSDLVRGKTGVKNLSELLLVAMEALVFQRLIAHENMISYYGIEAVAVSGEEWDYSEDLLKKYRKDRESLSGDRTAHLKNEMARYDTLHFLLHLTEEGENLLIRAADDQWKIVDKKHYNTRLIYTENFFAFLDAVINYFYNAFVPLLNGTKFVFRDAAHHEFESALFSPYYFESDIQRLNEILNEIHRFRSDNPSMAVTWSEVKKTMEGRESSPSHLWRFILGLGEFFYRIAAALHEVYESHKLWVYAGKQLKDASAVRKPMEPQGAACQDDEAGRPLSFYDCSIVLVPKTKIIEKNIAGKRLLNDAMDDGILIKLIAFAYQSAYECFNKKIFSDMDRRKEIMAELKTLSK